MVTWDEKYWYTEHSFEVDTEVRATAIARGVFGKDRNLISINDIAALTGRTFSSACAKCNQTMENTTAGEKR